MNNSNFVTDNAHTIEVEVFQQALRNWGRKHFREFPWRMTRDPYLVLMAEIMLHRTRVDQVLPVYERFVVLYPDESALYGASIEELHQELASLGLRWRVDLIRDMSTELKECFDGRVPEDRESLLSLSGVSDYIASAVRCFAYDLADPVIDTNTVRVAGRLFGLEITDSSRRNKRFRNLITALVDREHPRDYNYALLDLAHLVCHKRKAPECQVCPLRAYCSYGSEARSIKIKEDFDLNG